MPLTARHVDGRRIDSTINEQWQEVHRAGYEGLFCPECRHPMLARAGSEVPRRIRHFAHRGGSPSCSLTGGESEEHRRVKIAVARAVRELAGWTAEIEYPGNGWRADVLAISPSGDRRIAFEPQFSYIHESKARERTERHSASGVETVWLDARMRPNLEGLPRVRLHWDDQDPRVSVWGFDARAFRSPTVEPWWNEPRRMKPDQFARGVCLRTITYDDGYWASDADRAELARLTEAAHRARKEIEAERQALAERAREHAKRANAQRIAQWEMGRPQREAEAARWQSEDEARAAKTEAWAKEQREQAAALAAERDARAQRARIEQEAREAPMRAEQEAREAKARAEQARRAAEWPIERIRALMTETRSQEFR